MKDEYSTMNSEGDVFVFPGKFPLDSDEYLYSPQVKYRTYGALNEDKSNGFVVCHALTGNAALDSWWGDMLGPGRLFDTSKYFVICMNVLGSCYGTTGPTSVNPETSKVYGSSFPNVTIRDNCRLHLACVMQGLGVKHVVCVAGGSLGAMQSLEFACLAPENFVGSIIAMCAGTKHTAWQIGISECQRQAIYADPNWLGGSYLEQSLPAPLAGLGVARQMAMVTYRSAAAYTDKFGRKVDQGEGSYEVETYLRYQGKRFTQRFDPLSFVKITQLMDSYDLQRGRPSLNIKQPVLIVSVSSDVLYPPADQKQLHELIPHSELHVIESDAGHDGFLLEQASVEQIGMAFLSKLTCKIALPLPQDLELAATSKPWGIPIINSSKL
ncbi:homoserine O-acetyltransferase [Batrachochytrium salamandrivorans]|nr:homoserine O-acetyltransferase [Batrachochytrium salamandrivorans]